MVLISTTTFILIKSYFTCYLNHDVGSFFNYALYMLILNQNVYIFNNFDFMYMIKNSILRVTWGGGGVNNYDISSD